MLSRLSRQSLRSSLPTRSFSTSAFRSSSSITNSKFTNNKADFDYQNRSYAKAYTPDLVAKFKAATQQINDLKSSAQTDLKVPAIDWNYWSKEITTPGVVDQIRKEYESLSFASATVTEDEIKKQNEVYDKEIAQTEKRIGLYAKYRADAEATLSKWQKYHDNVMNNTLQDYFDLIPGIEEELEQQFWDGHYISDAGESANKEYDPQPLIDHLKLHGLSEGIPAPLMLPALPSKVGNYDWHKEQEKKKADFAAIGETYVIPKIKFREPKNHHELLPILQERKDGAPVFGAPPAGVSEHDWAHGAHH